MENLKFEVVDIEKPEGINFILGQSHFIKTVEDIHEAITGAVPEIKFGLAFCEASGPRLIRFSGTDQKMIKLAQDNIKSIGAGHSFMVFLGEGFYPVSILKTLQEVPEVVNIFCATGNAVQVIVAETSKGRGIVGVVDGATPLGVEGPKDIEDRKKFLRDLGYKK